MPSPADLELGKYLVERKVLGADAANRLFKVQDALERAGIRRPYGDLVLESGWVDGAALASALVDARQANRGFADPKARTPAEADVELLGKLPPDVQRSLGALSGELKLLGYERSATALAGDRAAAAMGMLRVVPKVAGETKLRVKAKDPAKLTPVPEQAPRPGTARRVAPAAATPAPTDPAAPPPEEPPPARRGPSRIPRYIAGVVSVAAIVLMIGLVARWALNRPAPVVAATPTPDFKYVPPDIIPSGTPAPKPTPSPTTSAPDEEVAEARKKYLESQEALAAKEWAEAQKLIAGQNLFEARKKLKLLRDGLSWTTFVQAHRAEIVEALQRIEDAPTASGDGVSGREYDLREESERRVDSASRDLLDLAAADLRRSRRVRARIKEERIDAMLRGGRRIRAATIAEATREDVRLVGQGADGPVDLLVAWDALDDASFTAAWKLVAKLTGADGWVDYGRAALERRSWKEAQAAFAEAARLDPSRKGRLPEPGVLLADPAVFRGPVCGAGRDSLEGRWSGADPDLAKDFVGDSGKVEMAAGSLRLQPQGDSLWTLRDLEVDGWVELEADLSGEGALVVAVLPDPAGRGAALLAGPSGIAVHEWDGGPKAALATSTHKPDGKRPLLVAFRQGLWRVRLGEQEVLTFPGPGPVRGRLRIGARGGPVVLGGLRIAARVPAHEMSRRLRSMDELLRSAGGSRGVVEAALSAEDEGAIARLPEEAKGLVAKAREAAARDGRVESLEAFDAAVKAAPEYAPSWYWRALARLATGDAAGARQDLATAVTKNAAFVEAHARLAALLLEAGEDAKAADSADEALRRRNGDPLALAVRGLLRVRKGDAALGRREMDLAVRLAGPADLEAWRLARRGLAVVRGPAAFGVRFVREESGLRIHAELAGAAAESTAAAYHSLATAAGVTGPARVAVFATRELRSAYRAAAGELAMDELDPAEAAARRLGFRGAWADAVAGALGSPERALPAAVLAEARRPGPNLAALVAAPEPGPARAWAAAHFLLRSDGGSRRPLLAAFAGDLAAGRPAAFVDAAAEAAWTKHLDSLEGAP